MVVSDASINNIMGGIESTAGVRLHSHRRKLKQRFDIIKKLGQGTYGKVQLGINKETGQEVAIKTIKKAKIETEADLVRIRREIQIMSSVQHPNIIHIYEVFENREKMVLVMEYAAGGELYDYLNERKVLVEEEARRIFRQISTAVYYCHKHKICHRDLKLENILLDEHGNAKIADFGLSNVFDEQRLLGTFCGSPLYASPEIVKGTPYHGPEVDCWSLGVLLYTLVYGAMPFDGSNFKRLVRQISQGDYFEPKKPSPASPLIREMLTVSPAYRADIEKICSHWWVNKDHTESCLDIAEDLANQTPVRLDLLLSLAPPPPGVGSDNLLITKDQVSNNVAPADVLVSAPARCHSMGSIMELDHPVAPLRPLPEPKVINNEASAKEHMKRCVSTEEVEENGAKRKQRSRRKDRDRSSDRRHSRSRSRNKQKAETKSKDELMEVDSGLIDVDPSLKESIETIVGSVKAATSSVDTIAGSANNMDEGLEMASSIDLYDRSSKEGVSSTTINEPHQKPSGEPVLMDSVADNAKVKVKRKKKVSSDSKLTDGECAVDKTDEMVTESILTETETNKQLVDTDLNTRLCEAMDSKLLENNSVLEGADVLSEKELNGESAVSKPIDIPKKTGAKPRKSKGDLSKMGSSTDKSGANSSEEAASPPGKPMERRRSKIFETAEKFNNMSTSEPKSPTSEKPKKVFIPGVKVSDAKRAFERKSSSAASVPGVVKTSGSKKSLDVKGEEIARAVPNESMSEANLSHSAIEQPISNNLTSSEVNKTAEKLSDLVINGADEALQVQSENTSTALVHPLQKIDQPPQQEEARMKKMKEAVETISNAISDENRKLVPSDSQKKVSANKPPVPLSQDVKVKVKTVSTKSPPISPLDQQSGKKLVRVQVAPNDIRLATIQVGTPEENKVAVNEDAKMKEVLPDTTPSESILLQKENGEDTKEVKNTDASGKKKSAKVEIILKSATLPRRKTSKAEIKLNSPSIPPTEYRTEVAHMVGPSKLSTQRSEVAFPVAAVTSPPTPRASSLEPEGKLSKPKEHIIPIRVEDSCQARPPVQPLQQQRSMSQRSGSLSRQSTQDSDTDSTISVGPEPIKKSPREYIIPIAVEGGGYITPRAGSLEPSVSEENATKPKQPKTSRLGRHRKISSLLSDASEDEGFNSPFATLQRHSSFNMDPETPEEEKGAFHMHRLRSSRPNRFPVEHNDSLSSAEEEDDDDGFEILTAESLFSTLLSRVRNLTQRLNVEEGVRPGFPTSTLMSQLKNVGRTSPSTFWNNMGEPLSSYRLASREKKVTKFKRLSENSQFSRSFSRDRDSTPWRRSTSRDVSDNDSVYSETLPRGMSTSDIIPGGDIGLSHYTPSLSRRIQPEANRRLLRTMSTREERPPPTPRRTGSSCVLPPLPRASTRRLPSADISSLHSSSSLSSVRSNSALNTRLRSDYDRSANSGDVSSTKAPKETLYPRTIERLEVPNPDENRESSYHLSANNRITNLTHSNSSINELLDDRKSHRSRIPSLLQFHRSSSLTRNEGKQKVNPDCVRGEDSSLRNTPDRSVLSKFFRQNSDEKSKSFIRSKSGAANDNTGSESTEALKKKSRKISRFLRPDFFDTPREESVYVKEKEAQKSAEAEAKKAKRIARRAALLEKRENNTSNPPEKLVNAGVDVSTSAKQCGSQTNVNVLDKSEQISDSKIAENGKNKFLHTLERKLEKLRSYGNDSLVPSRVEQAINSLQKQCGGNLAPSESMLLKRAVSVDDVAGTVSGGPVSNVLGLLRRIEGGPRARRTQSVYAGATSDTALLNQHEKLDKASLQSPNNGGSAIVNNSKLKQEGIENRDHLEKSLFENLTQSGKDVSLKDEESVIVPRLNCLNIKSSPSKPVNGEAIRLSEKAENDIKSQDLSQLKENNIKKSVACKENDKSVSNESKIKYEKRNCNGNNKRDESSIHNTKDIVEKGSKNFSRMENVKQNDFPEKESTLQIDTIRKKTEDQKVLNSLDAKYSSLVDSSMKNNGNNGNTQLLVNVNNTDPLRECAIAVQNPRELHLPLNKSNIPLSHDNTKKLDLSPLEDSFSVVSPVDESESIDSWSVCSDLDNRDLSASSFNKTPSPIFEDETVEERIRRKSFYTRFNDSKRKGHRKSSGGLSLGQRKTSLSDLNLGANPKKTVRSQSLYEPDYLDYSTYRRKSPVPSRSSSNVVNDFNTLPHSANALENGHGGIFYEYPEFQDSLSSNSLQESDLRNILASDDKQGYLCENRPGLGTFGRAGHLLRPTDFTSEILRRDPTAGYRSRLPTPTRVLRGESSFLDGKYNRNNPHNLSEPSTSVGHAS